MEKFVDDLFAKRGSIREEALSSIVNGLKINCRTQFARKNFATLLYRCLNSFKKGSSKEIVLAANALGFLSITIGSGDNANELYKELLPLIPQALKPSNRSLLLPLINCLAIASFVGANDFKETEVSMQIIWDFIRSSTAEKIMEEKDQESVLSASISAWSLLLTTISSYNLDNGRWQGAIPYFLNLLEVEDQSLCLAAIEAIALICEVGCLEKFGCDSPTHKIRPKEKGNEVSALHYSVQDLQETISDHVKRLLRESSLQGAALRTLNSWSNFSLDILEVLEDGRFHETTLKVGRHSLQLDSLSQLLQVNFVKRFLGRGFVTHMLENEFLRDVFNFSPQKQQDKLYISERDEVVVRLFISESHQQDSDEDMETTRRPKNSSLDKAKTQLLNKRRVQKGTLLSSFSKA